jgi:hypothetical protein
LKGDQLGACRPQARNATFVTGLRLVFLTVNEDPDSAAEAILGELFTAIEEALAGKV